MPTPPCNPPTRRQRERGSATAPLGPVAYTPARGWVYHAPLWWHHEGGRQPPRAADARPQKRCVTGGIAKAPTVAAMRTMTAKIVRTWVVRRDPQDGYAPRWVTLERGEAPSFFTLMQTCIPQTAEGFHEKLAELDDWKFNLVPKALNAVDVVLR